MDDSFSDDSGDSPKASFVDIKSKAIMIDVSLPISVNRTGHSSYGYVLSRGQAEVQCVVWCN